MSDSVNNKTDEDDGLSKRIITKTDIIMLVLLVVAGVIGFISVKAFMKKGGTVRVSVDGVTVKTVSLDDDGEFRIEGYDGGYNLLVVKNGKARIKEADCPDKLCVKQGKVSKEGESVICLPHRVVVEIID